MAKDHAGGSDVRGSSRKAGSAPLPDLCGVRNRRYPLRGGRVRNPQRGRFDPADPGRCFYLKKGIGIYFEHLAPYFTRHGRLRAEKESAANEDLITRIRRQIQENIRTHEALK